MRLEGEPGAVAAVERAWGEGPEGARVDRVEAADVAVEGLSGFRAG